METQKISLSRTFLFAMQAVCFLLLSPVLSHADCPETEVTAVFKVDNIYPLDLQLELLGIVPVGPITNPSEADMVAAVEAVQPGYTYDHMDRAGPFHLFFSDYGDWMANAIVDGRDGRVVFAGTVLWMGGGSATLPVQSSHPWSFPLGDQAPLPDSLEILPNHYWDDEDYPSEAQITNAVVDFLRDSDVVRSFGLCDSYSMVSYIYTPDIMFIGHPETSSSIIILSGRCGPPWNDVVSSSPLQPAREWLSKATPNPFNPRTTFSLNIPRRASVRVTIHSLDGGLVAELANGEFSAGEHSLHWDGQDDSGRAVGSGVFFVRLSTVEHSETLQITLLR